MSNIRELIGRVEYLGLDASALYDLHKAAIDDRISLEDYTHLLLTLKSQVCKPFPPGSQPLSIKLLLNQIFNKLMEAIKVADIPAPSPVVSTQSNVPATKDDGQVLKALEALSRQITDLKQVQNTVTVYQKTESDQPEVNMSGIEEIYIAPEIKTDHIKSNVKIESVNQSNIKSKLDRLKNIKNKE